MPKFVANTKTLIILSQSKEKTMSYCTRQNLKIRMQPPPAEEDAIVHRRTGCTSLEDLFKKCLDKGASNLTDDELSILQVGVDPQNPNLLAYSKFQRKQSPEKQAVMNDVYSSIVPGDEVEAITAACKESRSHELARRREEDYRVYEKMRLMRRQMKRERASAQFAPLANGIDRMASEDIQRFAIEPQLRPSDQVGPWGFVCFRLDYTDDSAWNSCRSRLDLSARRQLENYMVPKDILDGFRLCYVEDREGLHGRDREQLKEYLRHFERQDKIPW